MTLSRRLFTSAILISVTVGILFGMGPVAFGALTLFFVSLALFEFFTLLRHAKIPCFRLSGVVMGAVLPVVVTFEHGATFSGDVLFIVLGCLFLFILQFSRKDNTDALIGISLTLFGIMYVSWFLTFVLKIRFMDDGAIWAAYLLTVTKSADVGAYTVGSTLGKHLLIPHVSPKKSVEGLFGGILFSLIASLLFKNYLPLNWSYGHLAILGVLIGTVGQIGDLSESLMKRFARAKDSGNILPGMGGFLDAIDSILFTAPIFYFHLKVFA